MFSWSNLHLNVTLNKHSYKYLTFVYVLIYKYKKKLGNLVGTVYSAAIKSTETSWIGVVRNVQIL